MLHCYWSNNDVTFKELAVILEPEMEVKPIIRVRPINNKHQKGDDLISVCGIDQFHLLSGQDQLTLSSGLFVCLSY